MALPPLLVLAAALLLTGGVIHFGRRKPGYRHLQHTLSELGETGAPDQGPVAWGCFLPVGLLLLAAGLRAPGPAAPLAFCLATGYLGAAAFPCDPGSPASGTWRQGLHNLAGAVEYVGGGVVLLRLGQGGWPWGTWAGGAVLGAAAALTLLLPTGGRGLIQRGAELLLFGTLALRLAHP
jgi:hypothetical protein